MDPTQVKTPTAAEAGVIADKQLRVAIDEQLQILKKLPQSRERALSITKLQEAVMWLGLDLKRLNDPNADPSCE